MTGRMLPQMLVYVLFWAGVLCALRLTHFCDPLILPLAMAAAGILVGWLVILVLERQIYPLAERSWSRQLIRLSIYGIAATMLFLLLAEPHCDRVFAIIFSWLPLQGSIRVRKLPNIHQALAILLVLPFDFFIFRSWDHGLHWPFSLVLVAAEAAMFMDNYALKQRLKLEIPPAEVQG